MHVAFYCDDGAEKDIRVAYILQKYGLRGMFYIAPFYTKYKLATFNDIVEISKNHDIGGHTLTHKLLTRIPDKEQFREILEGKIEVEEIIGRKITSFAYPRGYYNPEVVRFVEIAGYAEARTMHQGATNLEGFGRFEKPITVHFHPKYMHKWKELFIEAHNKNGYFGVTCHSHELERFNLWNEYEEMCKYISEIIK